MKILLLIAVHGRPLTTKICFEGVKRLMEYNPDKYQIEPFIVYSNHDEAPTILQYGFDAMYHENRPLGKKLNAAIKRVVKKGKYDYLMQLGSDDILKPNALDIYEPFMHDYCPFFGLSNLYVYDIINDRIKQHNMLGVFGAGRMIRWDIVEYMSKQGGLWSNDRDTGLDLNSESQIYNHYDYNLNHVRHVTLNEPVVLDIKDGYNIHSYDSINGVAAQKPRAEILEDFGFNDLLGKAGAHMLRGKGALNL